MTTFLTIHCPWRFWTGREVGRGANPNRRLEGRGPLWAEHAGIQRGGEEGQGETAEEEEGVGRVERSSCWLSFGLGVCSLSSLASSVIWRRKKTTTTEVRVRAKRGIEYCTQLVAGQIMRNVCPLRWLAT